MMENTLNKPNASFHDLRDLILLIGLTLILAVIAFWMIGSRYDIWPGRSQETQDPSALGLSQTQFAEETGVWVIRVNVTLGGGAIGLRYQVVDPDKALIIHDEDYPPGFVNEATGQIFNIPWHEHSHDRDLNAGVIYYELIKNSGGAIHPGDTVSVLVGESRLENVVVQ